MCTGIAAGAVTYQPENSKVKKPHDITMYLPYEYDLVRLQTIILIMYI